MLFRGLVCGSTRRDYPTVALSPEGKRIKEREDAFSLSKVEYQQYSAAIKKYGHQSELNERHIREVARTIKIDPTPILENPKSEENQILSDPNFSLNANDKSYDVKRMLLVGFLYCSFNSVEEQQRELWLLVNPRLFDVVKKADAI